MSAAEPVPPVHAPMAVANGCFVESVALLDAWHEKAGAEAWAKLLRWGAKEADEVVAGQAVAVVERQGQRWCWDVNFGRGALVVDGGQRETAAVVAGPVAAR